MPDDTLVTTWTNHLTERQREQLRWLRSAKCTVEVEPVGPDPLHDQPEGVLLKVIVDQHAVIKTRGTINELPKMFDEAFVAAQALFHYINQPDDLGAPGSLSQ